MEAEEYKDFDGWKTMIQHPDHGDLLAQAREITKVSLSFCRTSASGRGVNKTIKRALTVLSNILDDLNNANTQTNTQSDSRPTTQTQPNTLDLSLLQSMHLQLEKVAAETEITRRLVESTHKEPTEAVVTLVQKQAPTPEVHSPTPTPRVELPSNTSTQTVRASSGPRDTGNSSAENHSQMTAPPNAFRKACPKVVFTDSEDLTSEQFKAKLISCYPEMNLPMIALNWSRWDNKTSHKFILTPLGYKLLSSQEGSTKVAELNLDWHLDLLTQQCRKCFKYGHGTSGHPDGMPILCRFCGRDKHSGRCDRRSCSQCSATGHAPDSLLCPARQTQLDIDKRLYDLDSNYDTIPSQPAAQSNTNSDSFLGRGRSSLSYS